MKRLLPALAILCLSFLTAFGQNVGVGNTSPNSKLDVSGDLALREGTAISVTAGANTIALPSAKNSVYRLTGATGAFSITSISGGNDGMILTLINATGQVMTITNGTIQTNTGANLVGSTTVSTVNLIYNATIGKWVVVSDEGFIQASTTTNVYNSDGTLTGNRTLTMGADNLTLSATSGSLTFNSSTNNGNVAMGVNNIATGTGGAAAFGSADTATGSSTFAAGINNKASGLYAIALGTNNKATSTNSIAVGANQNVSGAGGFAAGATHTVSGTNAAAFGQQNNASGYASFAAGELASASGQNAFSSGHNTTASGTNATAFGENSVGSGANSVAMGESAHAYSYGEVAVGQYNTSYSPASTTAYAATDRVFDIGNGQSGSNSDALTVLKNGNVGIGYSSPSYKLQVNGTASMTNLQVTNGANAGYILQSDGSGNGTWVSPSSIAATNVYNSDGTLTGSRTVTMGSSNLTFNTAGGNLVFNPSGTHGYVGIGTTSPICLLASTPNNILGSDNHGIVAGSLAWAVNDGGYAAAIYNGDNAYSADGLAVQIAGTSSYNRILDLSTSPTQGTTGTTVMAVLGTGNVGIGTGSPQQMLSIYTGMNIDQAGGNTGTVSSNALTFGNGSGEGMASNRNAGVNQFGLDFYTDYTNRLAITNSGNVGIGTTSPGSTLTVNGTTSTTNFQMTNGGTSGYILQSDASGNGTWVNPSTSLTNIYNSDGTLTGNRTVNIGANTLVFTNGTVGITSAHLGLGTTSPYGNFDYEGTNSAFHLYDFSGSPTVLSAEFHANSSLGALLRFTGPASGYMDIGQDSTGSFIIAQGSTGFTRFALNQYTGYVGIGTTAPSSTLQVNGKTTTTNLEMTNGANTGYIMQSDASGNASWVSPSSVTTGTTNTLTNTTNTITSTVNGVAATAPAVNTVSNTISGNTVSTTVNGIAGTAVTVPNVYTADGTLAGNRTVTQGADNMTFSSTTGNFVYSTTNTGGNVSMGYNNTVSGGNAVAIGSGSTANAAYAAAFGFGNTASGQFSTAMGSNSTASGKGSFTNGYGLTAASYNETALGTSNTSYTPTSATAWSATDRLFGVGNGSSPASPSDAFVILKNGNTGVGTASPSSTLQVNGKTTTTNFEMTNGATNGYILKSDASGNASWVNPTSITTATTNTLSLSSNTLTSTVNGVAATSNAVSGVSNTSSGNALSTTVNGVAGSGVNIINSNTSAWTQSGGLVNTINGVAATTTPASGTITNILGYNSSGAPVYQAISGLAESVSNTVSGNTISTTVDATTGTAVTVPNIYTANGTLTGARTVTMAADNLTFSSTTGNLIFSPSSTGYIGVNTASPQSLLANTATNIIGADGNGVNTPSLTWAMNTNGYTGAFYNASTVSNAMGLAVKIAGTASTNKLLDLSTGSSQATAGTSVMVVLGNGNTGISNASPAYTFDVTGNLRSTAASYLASGGGDVGIGTTAPAVKLHVIASSNTDGILIQNTAGGSGAQANLYFETYSGETIAGAAVSAIDDGLYSAHLTFSTRVPGSSGNSLSERMRLSSAGYLGIGTTTPGAPLDVEAVNNTYNEGSYRWFANSGSGTNTASCSSCNVSIYTPNRVEASEFDATSDRRIKKDITPLPAATALERADLLNVVTFRYIDQLSKGKKNKSGFIAQEVESVLPNAVNQDEGFIPNVFDVPAHAEMRGATLVVTTAKDHDFAEGDQIRIYDNANRARDVNVARVISPDQFEIAHWEGGSDSLFVYGKKVYDYRNVDYDQITAVAIGAIQELNKKMQALEQKSNESEARNQKLQKELTDIKTAKASAAELEQLKAEVETLKQIVGAKAEK